MDEEKVMLTRDEINKLALDNVIVNSCLMHHRQGVITYEQALIMMVKALALQTKEQFGTIVELAQRAPATYSPQGKK